VCRLRFPRPDVDHWRVTCGLPLFSCLIAQHSVRLIGPANIEERGKRSRLRYETDRDRDETFNFNDTEQYSEYPTLPSAGNYIGQSHLVFAL
jgi:hypothetical protein